MSKNITIPYKIDPNNKETLVLFCNRLGINSDLVLELNSKNFNLNYDIITFFIQFIKDFK